MTHLPPELLKIPVAKDLRWKERFVQSGRLRSGWRLLVFVLIGRLAQVLAAIMFSVTIAFLLTILWSGNGWTFDQVLNRLYEELSTLSSFTPFALALRFWSTISLVVIVFVFRRWVDKRSLVSLGLEFSKGWWREAVVGFAITIVAWLAVFLIVLQTGGMQVMGFAWDTADWLGLVGLVFSGLLFNMFISIAEEIDARGYVLQNLAEGIKFLPAVLVSSLYFGVIHLLNPGGGLGSIIGVFLGGLLFALGYYVTGNLWLPMGMHAAWNLAEGPLLGFPVGGLDMGGLIRLNITGSDWLMGGPFGPEAGVFGVLIEIGLIGAIVGWHYRKQIGAIRTIQHAEESGAVEDEEIESDDKPISPESLQDEERTIVQDEELDEELSGETSDFQLEEQQALEEPVGAEEVVETEPTDYETSALTELDQEEDGVETTTDRSAVDALAAQEPADETITLGETIEDEIKPEEELLRELDDSTETLPEAPIATFIEETATRDTVDPIAVDADLETSQFAGPPEVEENMGEVSQGNLVNEETADAEHDTAMQEPPQPDESNESQAEAAPVPDHLQEQLDVLVWEVKDRASRHPAVTFDNGSSKPGKARRAKAKNTKAKSSKSGSKTKTSKPSGQGRKRKPE